MFICSRALWRMNAAGRGRIEQILDCCEQCAVAFHINQKARGRKQINSTCAPEFDTCLAVVPLEFITCGKAGNNMVGYSGQQRGSQHGDY